MIIIRENVREYSTIPKRKIIGVFFEQENISKA